jgi:hypothetical protein
VYQEQVLQKASQGTVSAEQEKTVRQILIIVILVLLGAVLSRAVLDVLIDDNKQHSGAESAM